MKYPEKFYWDHTPSQKDICRTGKRNYQGDFSDPMKIRKVENYLTGIRLHKVSEGQVELCDLINEINHKQMKQII